MTTDNAEYESEDQQHGVFVEIDEDDPFVMLQLQVKNESGAGIVVGRLEADPGRYELRRVGDAD